MNDLSSRPASDDRGALIPLPDGVDDAVINLAQAARALDVSTTTMNAFVAEGAPYITRGTNGRSYEFQLSELWSWYERRRLDDEERRAKADASAAQLRLSLLGEEQPGEASSLTAKEQKELYEAALKFMAVARGRRELISAKEVLSFFEAAFVVIRSEVLAIPEKAEVSMELGPEQTEELVEMIHAALLNCRDRIEGMDVGRQIELKA